MKYSQPPFGDHTPIPSRTIATAAAKCLKQKLSGVDLLDEVRMSYQSGVGAIGNFIRPQNTRWQQIMSRGGLSSQQDETPFQI